MPRAHIRMVLCLLALLCVVTAWGAGETAKAFGFTFKSLDKDDLDTIQVQIGHRVGVLVEAVEPAAISHGRAPMRSHVQVVAEEMAITEDSRTLLV